MPLTQAQKRAKQKYDSKTYVQTKLTTRHDLCINRRIELAAKRHGLSKNAYIICALESALKADRLTLDEYKAMQGNDENQSDMTID